MKFKGFFWFWPLGPLGEYGRPMGRENMDGGTQDAQGLPQAGAASPRGPRRARGIPRGPSGAVHIFPTQGPSIFSLPHPPGAPGAQTKKPLKTSFLNDFWTDFWWKFIPNRSPTILEKVDFFFGGEFFWGPFLLILLVFH